LDIGIDLGTAYTSICAGREIKLCEPSVVALETQSGKPIAFGEAALRMVGRTPERITTVRPIARGAIANYNVAEQMLHHYMRSAFGGKMVKPRVMVSIPSGITAVQQRSIIDAAQNAGARNVCLVEGPVAAAIGLGVDFDRPHGSIIVDIGAGTTDVAVISMGGLAQCDSVGIASSDIDEAIIRYVRKELHILIGDRTAEDIKKQIGCVVHRPIEIAMKARGRNLFTGLPQLFEITTNEVADAVRDTSYAICNAVQSVLEKTPPELVGDIATDGIMLCGAAARMHGMAELMTRYTGIKASVVENAKFCVAVGTGKALENLDLLKNGDYRFRTLQDLIIQ